MSKAGFAVGPLDKNVVQQTSCELEDFLRRKAQTDDVRTIEMQSDLCSDSKATALKPFGWDETAH